MRVHVEVLSWVTKFVGGPGTGQVTLTEEVEPRATVRAVLRRVTDRFPELGDALWEAGRPREIGDNIEVMVNNAVLGLTHDLDSEVLDGDRITLLGQYMGGAPERPGPGPVALGRPSYRRDALGLRPRVRPVPPVGSSASLNVCGIRLGSPPPCVLPGLGPRPGTMPGERFQRLPGVDQ